MGNCMKTCIENWRYNSMSAADIEIERIRNMSDEEFFRTHRVEVYVPPGY